MMVLLQEMQVSFSDMQYVEAMKIRLMLVNSCNLHDPCRHMEIIGGIIANVCVQ